MTASLTYSNNEHNTDEMTTIPLYNNYEHKKTFPFTINL